MSVIIRKQEKATPGILFAPPGFIEHDRCSQGSGINITIYSHVFSPKEKLLVWKLYQKHSLSHNAITLTAIWQKTQSALMS